MLTRLAIALCFLCALKQNLVFSQETQKKAVQLSEIVAEVKTKYGDVFQMSPIQEFVKVKTDYGELTIPFCDIQRIEFGYHVPELAQKEIGESITTLGSANYKDREDATKDLISRGYLAYPAVLRATRHVDKEVSARAALVVSEIEKSVAKQFLLANDEDIIETKKGKVFGQLIGDRIEMKSNLFGKIVIELCVLKSIDFYSGGRDIRINIGHEKCNGDNCQWVDTDILVKFNSKLTIKVEGKLDLWPTGPGQYVTGPFGFTGTKGKSSNFFAGALIGRIGKGEPFLVGDHYEAVADDEGKLQLMIVSPPWNNNFHGNYQIQMRIDYSFLNVRR